MRPDTFDRHLTLAEISAYAGREITEAMLEGTYAADRITEGKIRKPIKINGRLYVNTGGCFGDVPRFELVELIHRSDFQGEAMSYSAKLNLPWPCDKGDDCVMCKYGACGHGEAARQDSNGFYYGMTVWRGKEEYVLGRFLGFKDANERTAIAALTPVAPIWSGNQGELFDFENGGCPRCWTQLGFCHCEPTTKGNK